MNVSRYIILCTIFLIIASLQLKSQTVTITSNKPISLSVYQPLDYSLNRRVKTSEIEVEPNLSLVYNFNFTNFGYVIFQIKNNSSKITVPLINNTSLNIKVIDNMFEITGDNAEGIIFFNSFFLSEGFQKYTQQIESLFGENISSCQNKYEELSTLIYNLTAKHTLSFLDSLHNKSKVSKSFYEVIKKDVEIAINNRIIDKYKALLKANSLNKNFIKHEIDRLFSLLNIADKNISMYYYSSTYLSSYYRYKYANKESIELQKRQFGLGLESTFGPYYIYLYAPDYIKLPILCNAIIIQKEYGVNEFDTKKMYNYLLNNFPQSEYLSHLSINFEETKKIDNNVIPKFIKNQINNLKELASVAELKKNYLLVDLWATWCTPCKLEFQRKESLYDLLSHYDNINLVYISIDEDRFNSYWEKSIKDLNLAGIHIRANTRLYKDIEEKVYDNGVFLIPRYFIIDTNGNIIYKDLPRLNEIEKIKKILDETITNN